MWIPSFNAIFQTAPEGSPLLHDDGTAAVKWLMTDTQDG